MTNVIINKFEFTIYGSDLSRTGNPMGFKTTTFKAKKISTSNKKYSEWLSYVRSCLIMAGYGEVFGIEVKPFTCSGLDKDDRWIISTWIYYSSDKRPDSGNVTKGIADALFRDDSHVLHRDMGYWYDSKNPRVNVILELVKEKDQLKYFKLPNAIIANETEN